MRNLNRRVKLFLKNNKIYFETIFMVALTAMSICVSISSNEVAKKELMISEDENSPIFTYKGGKINADNEYEKIHSFENIGQSVNITNIDVSDDLYLRITNDKEDIDYIGIRIDGRYRCEYGENEFDTALPIVRENSTFDLKKFIEELKSITNGYEKIKNVRDEKYTHVNIEYEKFKSKKNIEYHIESTKKLINDDEEFFPKVDVIYNISSINPDKKDYVLEKFKKALINHGFKEKKS